MKQRTLKWIYKVPGREKIKILLLALVRAVNAFSGVLYALLIRSVIDSAVSGDNSSFWKYIMLSAALVVFQILLRAADRQLTESARSSIENRFKTRLLDTLLSRNYLSVSSVHSAEWMNRLTNDTVVVANACTDVVPGLVSMAVKLIGALAMMFVLDARFAALLIPLGALLILLSLAFRKKMKALHREVQEADGRLRVRLQEMLGSLLMLHSFASEDKAEAGAELKMEEHRDSRMKKNAFSNFCNTGFSAAMSGMYLFCVGYCGLGILKGTISFGTLTAMTMLVSQIQSPFVNISGILPKFYSMLSSAERLMEAEDLPEYSKEARPLDEVSDFYENTLKSLRLEDVSFAYYAPSETPDQLSKAPAEAVSGLSMDIAKGQFIAFTGRSGCGKSTAIKLLMCAYDPDGGRRYMICRDGSETELDASWRRLFAYVPQGNLLMSGTIREAVSLSSDGDTDDGRVRKALEIACADPFVNELESGLDTVLGERGTGLSEGQMQRIAIARAVYSGSPVLLLDEVTSALDAETERKVLENLRSMTDKTVLIVTHREAALDYCDKILEFTDTGAEVRNDERR